MDFSLAPRTESSCIMQLAIALAKDRSALISVFASSVAFLTVSKASCINHACRDPGKWIISQMDANASSTAPDNDDDDDDYDDES